MSLTKKLESQLIALFQQRENIDLAFLFGSRARNEASPGSDWDFAIYWSSKSSDFDNLLEARVRIEKSVPLTGVAK